MEGSSIIFKKNQKVFASMNLDFSFHFFGIPTEDFM